MNYSIANDICQIVFVQFILLIFIFCFCFICFLHVFFKVLLKYYVYFHIHFFSCFTRELIKVTLHRNYYKPFHSKNHQHLFLFI